MDLTDYVDALRGALTTAAAAGGAQAQETAHLLADTMEPAVRLALIDALSAMAAEVTAALDDGTLVDVRLRGRDPEVVVVPAAQERPSAGQPVDEPADNGSTARISLRCPTAQGRAEAPPGWPAPRSTLAGPSRERRRPRGLPGRAALGTRPAPLRRIRP